MKEFIENLKLVWNYAKKGKKRFVRLIILQLIYVIFNIVTPILSAQIIINLTGNNFSKLILISLVILGVNLIGNFIIYVIKSFSLRIYRDTLAELGIDLVRNILKIENKSMDKNGSGVFIERITRDSSRLADVFNSMLDKMSNIIKYIGFLIAILIINRIIFIYVLFTLVFLYIIEKIRTNKRDLDDREARKANERISGFVGETVRGSRDIKMLNSEVNFINEFGERINNARDKEMKMLQTSWNYNLLTWQFIDFNRFILIIILVFLMKRPLIDITLALVIYTYVERIHVSVYLVGDVLSYIKDFNLSSERIFGLIVSDEFTKEKFGETHINKIKGNFEFNKVTFGYNEKKVLDNLSFKIKANETVAFVGKSGTGKTTIFNLLCKMYEIESGTIKIDGININELDKDSIRGNISIISQSPYIFNMTIKENLTIVKPDLTDEEMKIAIKMACLEDFIEGLPDGYDTVIGEGGVNLSGGQKQRLAIARALVQKTEIILFDEATSALDNETQEKIQEAIYNMRNEYTILIIAHRLSTIINADRILYLENGKIEAEGKHEDLIKNSEKYKKLYEMEILNKIDVVEKQLY